MPPAKKPAAKAKAKPPVKRKPVTRVAAAVERELDRLDPEIKEGGLAASALALGRRLDRLDTSAAAAASCARALRETLDRLRELQPPAEETDQLDELSTRRAERLGSTAAKDLRAP